LSHIFFHRLTNTFLIILFFLGVAFISCDDAKRTYDSDVLAAIDDLKVTKAHLEGVFKRYYYKTGRTLKPSPQTKRSILQSEFENYVMAVHARDLGLNRDERSIRKLGMIKRKVLAEEYLNRNVLVNVDVSEKDIRELFLRFNTRLRASHLYAPDKQSAEKLYERVKNGETFDELAREVFQNPNLANSGGDIGEFTVDELDLFFENTAYNLEVGEISKPVRTAQGYSIIKLTDRKVRPIITEYEYASKKDAMRSFAMKRKQQMATRSHVRAVVENFDYLEGIFAELWESVNRGEFKFYSNDRELLLNFGDKEQVIASLENFTFTMGDLLSETYHTPLGTRENIDSEPAFTEFVKGAAYRKYAVSKAIEQGIDKIEDVKGSIDHTYLVYLANRAIEELKKQIKTSDQELLDYFVEHKTRFEKPVELDLARIVVSSEQQANKVHQKLQSGASFKDMVHQHTINNFDRLNDGQLGRLPLPALGFLGPALSKLKAGQISGPMKYQQGEYHIYQVLGKTPGRLMTFKEAREGVKRVLVKDKLEQLKTEVIAQVKKKHNAYIDEKAIEELVINI